jgi:tetratricopeptide (TPR) repeat protein
MRLVLLCLLSFFAYSAVSSPTQPAFNEGTNAYYASDFAHAARAFRKAAGESPAAGTFQNLGNAEWQRGQVGAAVLAWEQALWLSRFDKAAHQNLQFGRKAAQLESPELRWYEVISTWLPVNTWAWITGCSLWLAVAIMMLPAIIGRNRASWQQALAALSLMIFLLSLPALIGVYTRTGIGIVLHEGTPLRLTPTAHAQILARLTAGNPARVERTRGSFLLIRTPAGRGWVQREQLGMICPIP